MEGTHGPTPELICEGKSVAAHRTGILVEVFVLLVLWGLFIWFLSLALSAPGNLSAETWIYLTLWGAATVGFTWYAVPGFRYTRIQVYSTGFVLPLKKGLRKEVFVAYTEVESILEVSEGRLAFEVRGREYSVGKHRFGDCFETLREKLLTHRP